MGCLIKMVKQKGKEYHHFIKFRGGEKKEINDEETISERKKNK